MCIVADMAMQLNRAMFTQNGSCGYVLKPYAMWMRTQDESIDFSKFNPWEVERVGLPLLTVNLEVISGVLRRDCIGRAVLYHCGLCCVGYFWSVIVFQLWCELVRGNRVHRRSGRLCQVQDASVATQRIQPDLERFVSAESERFVS